MLRVSSWTYMRNLEATNHQPCKYIFGYFKQLSLKENISFKNYVEKYGRVLKFKAHFYTTNS